MSRTKSTPTKPKLSYAERVVSALYQLQSDRKKQSVHMSALRVRVRKTAEAHNDSLGPHANSWIAKAVTKLQHDHVVESPKTGYLALAKDAKATYNATRRHVTDGSSKPLSSTLEGYVAKSVLHSQATRGTKRRRISTIAPRLASSASEDEEEFDTAGHSISSRRFISNKRARSGAVWSRMTKAELVDEIRALRDAQVSGDSERNKDLIRMRKEVEFLRAKLSVAGKSALASRSLDTQHISPMPSPFSSPLTSRASTPVSTRPHTPEANPSGSPPHHNQFSSSVRKESNPWFSNVSRHLTSAPTSIDNDVSLSGEPGLPDTEDGVDEDPRCMDPTDARHGLVTPSSSPFTERFQCHTELGDSEGGDVTVSDLSSLRQFCDATYTEYTKFKSLLSSRDHTISVLEANIKKTREAFAAERARLQESSEVLEERGTQLSILESQGTKLKMKLAEQEEILRLQHEKYELISKKKVQLEASLVNQSENEVRLKQELAGLREKVVSLESLRQEDLISQLNETVSRCEAKDAELARNNDLLASLRIEHQTTQNALECTRASEADLSHELALLQHQKAVLQARADIDRASLLALQERAKELEQALGERTSELTTTLEHARARDVTISGLRASLDDTNDNLAQCTTELQELRIRVPDLKNTINLLEDQLRDKETACNILDHQLAQTASANDDLKNQLAESVQKLAATCSELSKADQARRDANTANQEMVKIHLIKVDEYETKMEDLQRNLNVAQLRAEQCRVTMDKAEAARDEMTDDLRKTTTELADARHSLISEQQRISTLKRELATERLQSTQAAQELNSLREAYNDCDATIIALRAKLIRIRQKQADCMVEIDAES